MHQQAEVESTRPDNLYDDQWDSLLAALQSLAESRKDWCGYPMPVSGFKMVLHDKFPYPDIADVMLEEDDIQHYATKSQDEDEHVNSWYSFKYRAEIHIFRNVSTGKSELYIERKRETERLDMAMRTLGACRNLSLEAEQRAMKTLKSLVRPVAYHYYVMTGSFLETSKRSHVTYFFRRCKPTVALAPDKHGNMKVLAALCLHPLGHYDNTFCGCMVPTDDVIAHLVMMRGDEHKFWGKANQHSPWEANSGI